MVRVVRVLVGVWCLGGAWWLGWSAGCGDRSGQVVVPKMAHWVLEYII